MPLTDAEIEAMGRGAEDALAIDVVTLAAEVKRLRDLIDDFARRRGPFHWTFNGGWTKDNEQNRAYHHGMDTVFDLIDSLAKEARDAD